MELFFDEAAIEENKQLAKYCETISKLLAIEFLNTATFVEASDKDKVHLNYAANKKLALILIEKIKQILS